MELRQIEYFCMVAKLSSFTKAAEELHIAQPSITQAIRKLEEELGIQLFDRCKKRILLTDEGSAFYARMEILLRDLDQAVQEIHDFNELRKGTLKVGVPPMIEAYLFPDIFSCFKRQYPGLNLIAFEESSSLDAAGKLEKNELDLAIIILPEHSDTLKILCMIQEQLLLCMHTKHPLANHQTVSFDQLKNEQFILLKEGSYQHHVTVSRCRRKNFLPNTIFSSNQITTIKGLVANGVGISLLMEMVVRNDPEIAVASLAEPICFDIGLAWKKEKTLSVAAQTFVKFIEQRYKSG